MNIKKLLAALGVLALSVGITQRASADLNSPVSPPAALYKVETFARGSHDNQDLRSVTVGYGAATSINFETSPPVTQIVLHGVVIEPSGKPAAGAEVLAFPEGMPPLTTTTDSHGHYAFDRSGPLPTSTVLYARLGTLATADGSKSDAVGFATLKLAPNTLCSVHGKLRDEDGNVVAGAKVTVLMEFKDHGGDTIASVVTDSSGQYHATGLFANATYKATASAVGCQTVFSKEFLALPGHDIPAPGLVLIRVDSFVGGTVVDAAGKPIVGANVSATNVDNARTVTDIQGRFLLKGVPRKQTTLVVSVYGGRSTMVAVPSGVDNAVIMLR